MLEAWSVVGNVTAGTAGDTNADETNRWKLFSYLLLLKQITANDHMATKDSERENIIMIIYFEYEMDLDDRSNSAQFLLVF